MYDPVQLTPGATDAQLVAVIFLAYLVSFFAYAFLHASVPASFRNVSYYHRTLALVTVGWPWRMVFTAFVFVAYFLWTL